MFFVAFALSGVHFTAMRLVSEELGRDNGTGVKKAVGRCVVYALFFGTAALLFLFFGENVTGGNQRVCCSSERVSSHSQ